MWNFGDIMVLVWTPQPPPPPHAKPSVSRNCDTNSCIKFIIDTAIGDLEWKNPTDQLHIWCSHGPTIEGGPYRFWQKLGIQNGRAILKNNSKTKSCVLIWNGHFVWKKFWKMKVAYWSELARNSIERDFRSSKMTACSHFVKFKKKVAYWIWNGKKCDKNWFSVIQNARRRPFCEILTKFV